MQTTGFQDFVFPVAVSADTSFVSQSGGTVTFDDTLDSAPGQTRAVTVAGNAVFSGAVGGTDPLARLTVGGTSAVSGGLVRSQLDQSFAGDVTVATTDVLFRSLNGKSVTYGGSSTAPSGCG